MFDHLVEQPFCKPAGPPEKRAGNPNILYTMDPI